MVLDTRVCLQREDRNLTRSSKEGDCEYINKLLNEYSQAGSLCDLSKALFNIRQSVPAAQGFEVLYKIAANPHDSRQLLAAQILGYHREWLTVSNGLHRHLELARNTKLNLKVIRALVWGLRQREEILEFVEHPSDIVAREAVLGVPLARRTISTILDLVRKSFSSELTSTVLVKLRQIHPSLMLFVRDTLIGNVWSENALRGLFSVLPQIPIFELFINEEKIVGGVDLEIEKSTRWHNVRRIAKEVLSSDPTGELLRFLLTSSGDDEEFSRRHNAFVRSAIKSVDGGCGEQLIDDLEVLTRGASEEKVFRLAQNFVELGSRLEGEDAKKIQAILDEWKSRSVELKLKIFHLEQKII